MSTSASEMNKAHSEFSSRITDFKVEDLLHVSNIQGSRFWSVFKVNFKHVYTVGQLKKVISTRHGYSVVALLYHGVCLADEHKLAHLIPNLQNMGAPRISVRTRLHTQPKLGGMSLQVKGLSGSTFLVHMAARSIVADLVTAITDYEAYSSDQDIQIKCAGKSLSALDSSLALTKCNLVVSGSVVHVAGKLRGGDSADRPVQTFVDMENISALKTVKVSPVVPGHPIWKVVSPGLNIQGTCPNSFCEAFGDMMYCRIGFAVFSIAEVVECPECWSILTTTTVGFYECEWMFEGRKAGVPAVDVISQWHLRSTEDEYEYFDDEEGRNVANWSHLVITAKPLTSNDAAGRMKKLDRKDCAICFGTLRMGAPIPNVDMTCGHTVHSDCWTTLLRCGYSTCPTCRDPIVAVVEIS